MVLMVDLWVFFELDVVVVCVWCSSGGDHGVVAMVDQWLLWFWGFFFFFWLVVAGDHGVVAV